MFLLCGAWLITLKNLASNFCYSAKCISGVRYIVLKTMECFFFLVFLFFSQVSLLILCELCSSHRLLLTVFPVAPFLAGEPLWKEWDDWPLASTTRNVGGNPEAFEFEIWWRAPCLLFFRFDPLLSDGPTLPLPSKTIVLLCFFLSFSQCVTNISSMLSWWWLEVRTACSGQAGGGDSAVLCEGAANGRMEAVVCMTGQRTFLDSICLHIDV